MVENDSGFFIIYRVFSIYRVGLNRIGFTLKMSSGNCAMIYIDSPQKHKVHTVTETGCICFEKKLWLVIQLSREISDSKKK